jgi:lipooligosaccharide transport system ATP-binding protein
MRAMCVIEAQNVVKRYGTFTAVDGVSFQVQKGEFFGLLGPNGAGKTSVIRMIYGFSPVSDGQMIVFDLDIRTDWRKIRSRMGVCQQENTLDPDLTVEQNLLIYARYFDMDGVRARGRAEELLEFFRWIGPTAAAGAGADRRTGSAHSRRAYHRSGPAIQASSLEPAV